VGEDCSSALLKTGPGIIILGTNIPYKRNGRILNLEEIDHGGKWATSPLLREDIPYRFYTY
jgi:hypothetical protein